jgi:hypothetical protein
MSVGQMFGLNVAALCIILIGFFGGSALLYKGADEENWSAVLLGVLIWIALIAYTMAEHGWRVW